MKCGKTIRVNIKGEAHHLPYKLRDSPIMWGYHFGRKAFELRDGTNCSSAEESILVA